MRPDRHLITLLIFIFGCFWLNLNFITINCWGQYDDNLRTIWRQFDDFTENLLRTSVIQWIRRPCLRIWIRTPTISFSGASAPAPVEEAPVQSTPAAAESESAPAAAADDSTPAPAAAGKPKGPTYYGRKWHPNLRDYEFIGYESVEGVGCSLGFGIWPSTMHFAFWHFGGTYP